MKRRLRDLLACLVLSAATVAGSLVAAGTAAAGPIPVAGHHGRGQVTVPVRLPLDRMLPGRLPAGAVRQQAGAQAAHVTAGAAWEAGGSPVRLAGAPGVPAVNPATHTLYVPIQCTNVSSGDACNATPANVMAIIDTATCTPTASSHCRVVATARVGRQPLMALVNPSTDTVYVLNAVSGTVSVINGATCNARVTHGCARPLAAIRLGQQFPVAAAINDRTHTLYVANVGSPSISVVNIARCDARTTRGCGQTPRVIPDPNVPDAIAVNIATNTVYAANAGQTGNGNTVWVINGATCNGSTGRGCRARPHVVTVGSGPFWVEVDHATNTVYTANNNDGTVSVINGAACNARVTSGCGKTPVAVQTGAGAQYVAVDPALHTVFAVNQGDGTVSEIGTRTCNGHLTSGCPVRARNAQAAFFPPVGSNANAFALNPLTGTAYLVNIGGAAFLQAMRVTGCDAANQSGCRSEAPAVAAPEFLYSVDPATDTIYAGNLSAPQIDVINGATCRAGHLSHCAPVATIPMPDPQANVGAIDEATHTLYASNEATAGAVMMINTATCNATHTAGCAATPAKMPLGAFPNIPVLNPATHTVYVSYGPTSSQLAVINAATCNAAHTAGCARPAAVGSIGPGTFNLAVSVATDTVYGTTTDPNANGDAIGHTISVLNGATCNATDTSGCAHPAAQVRVGLGPFGIAVSDATHTVYVSIFANGDLPGTVWVLNGATCKGTDVAGCGRVAVMSTGRSPLQLALDPGARTLYAVDFSSAAVTVLNLARCTASVTAGCGTAARQVAVGSLPAGIAVNPATCTVYVANVLVGVTSVFGTRHTP
jgi:DNA-binding beta-propeller fold protein YncE